jgi:RHS repeat-associated protein
VGGLLEVVYKDAQTTNCFVAFDGNGNVAALTDGGSTNILAQYEYGPFGEVIRATGPMAKANPFRFSTKYQDDETDLLYYGYRYYNASTGRWLSRDPIFEAGGPNLYAFVANGMGIDALGHVQLNYMNYPQWEPNAEMLFAGHYWTFDASDAPAFSRTTLGKQQFYEGVMLWHHTSRATITDCKTGVTLSDESRDLYFYEKFMLGPQGNVFAINDADAFDNGHGAQIQHPFIETANATMRTIFLQSPGFKFGKSGTGRPTKGHFETTLEVHFDASNDYDWAQNFEPLSMAGYREIDGHDMLRRYNGFTAGAPQCWQISPYYTETINISFDWDNCCGKRSWNYTCSPRLNSAGETRWRYSPNNPDHDPTYPGAINLLAQPSSNN